jgi:hypothetical protein
MAARVHRPLSVIAFNANVIWRQSYELSKQLQDLHIDVVVPQRYISKPMKDSLFQIFAFMGLNVSREEKAELPLQ